jgi:hypothetical protein
MNKYFTKENYYGIMKFVVAYQVKTPEMLINKLENNVDDEQDCFEHFTNLKTKDFLHLYKSHRPFIWYYLSCWIVELWYDYEVAYETTNPKVRKEWCDKYHLFN